MDNIQLDICNEQDKLDIDQKMIETTIEFVSKHFSLSSVSISLAIIDDDEIQELKGRYFGEFYATDVISFDLSGDKEGLDCEIVVNAQRAKRLADEKGIDPQAELNLYILHGLLHQLGYDDATPDQYKIMHEKEDQLLEQMGLGKIFSGKGL